MFCPNCGAEATDGQRFCANCGTQLSIVTRPVVTEPTVVEPVVSVEPITLADPVMSVEAADATVAETVVVEPIAIPIPGAADDAIAAEEAAGTLVSPVPVAETDVLPQGAPVAQAAPLPVDATVARPVPQSAPAEPASQVAPAGYPQASPYAQRPAQQAPAKKPWYDTAGFKVAIAAVVVAAVLRVGLGALGLFGGRGTTADPHGTDAVEVVTEGAGDSSADEPEATEVTGSDAEAAEPSADPELAATPSADGDYLNSYGYPTLLAYMELDGSELASLVESNRYVFHEDDGAGFYAKRDGTIVFNVVTSEGSLDKESIKALSTGGHDEAAVFVTILEGYDSVSEVLGGIAGCVVEDVKNVDDLELVALVHGPSMEEYLVDVYDVEDGDYEIDLYTPEAVAAGFFDIVNDGTYGDTPAEAFRNFG